MVLRYGYEEMVSGNGICKEKHTMHTFSLTNFFFYIMKYLSLRFKCPYADMTCSWSLNLWIKTAYAKEKHEDGLDLYQTCSQIYAYWSCREPWHRATWILWSNCLTKCQWSPLGDQFKALTIHSCPMRWEKSLRNVPYTCGRWRHGGYEERGGWAVLNWNQLAFIENWNPEMWKMRNLVRISPFEGKTPPWRDKR